MRNQNSAASAFREHTVNQQLKRSRNVAWRQNDILRECCVRQEQEIKELKWKLFHDGYVHQIEQKSLFGIICDKIRSMYNNLA